MHLSNKDVKYCIKKNKTYCKYIKSNVLTEPGLEHVLSIGLHGKQSFYRQMRFRYSCWVFVFLLSHSLKTASAYHPEEFCLPINTRPFSRQRQISRTTKKGHNPNPTLGKQTFVSFSLDHSYVFEQFQPLWPSGPSAPGCPRGIRPPKARPKLWAEITALFFFGSCVEKGVNSAQTVAEISHRLPS